MNLVSKVFQKMSKSQKIQAIIASAITAALVVTVPVYAWFTLTKKAETMTKVQEPKNLDIRAGNAEAIKYFDLNDIDIETITPENPKRYVFCVVTDSAKTYYDLQIAHTTNIPFSYKLYRAEVGNSSDPNTVKYTTHTTPSEDIYYKRVGNSLNLQPLNADTANTAHYGRTLAKDGDAYYDLVYGGSDDPEIYAIAKYEQVKELETLDPDHDFYILELGIATVSSAEGFDEWNATLNKKETDVIYITASRTVK